MHEDKWFNLYLAMRSEHFEALKQHAEHFGHYLTLVMAVLTVTGAAVFELHQSAVCPLVVGAVASIGFVTNIGLCIVAIFVCSRYYEAFLEAVSVMAKLEASLHLEARPSGAGNSGGTSVPFANDADLFPDRYRRDRALHKSEASFVKAARWKGVNLLVIVTMCLLALANLVVWAGAILAISGRWSL
jgi:hypothetical protein